MDKQEIMSQCLELIEKSDYCMLGTNREDGFPNVKAMLNMRHEGLKKIWLSTNTSSKRVQQLKKDNRACIYYLDEENIKGLMLVGTVEILRDKESRELIWFDGAEKYYPLGVDDPDYSVLRFTATEGNYYHKGKTVFPIE